MEISKTLAEQNGSQSSAVLGELTGDELLVQNGNQAGSAMEELTDDELLAQNGNQAGVGVAEYFDELDKRPKILTFTANEDRSSVGFVVFNEGHIIPKDYRKPSLQYSIDGGKTWQDYDLQISDDPSEATPIDLDEGESVMFKGVNENLAYFFEAEDEALNVRAHIGGRIAASGDVTSLLNGAGGDVALPQYCYFGMFQDCGELTQAPELPATTLALNCYSNMFNGCGGLTQAPELPATVLASSCYASMFHGCRELTQAPELPATVLASSCYSYMFSECDGLTAAPALPATTLVEYCYNSMFHSCTGLTQAPELPATTLASNCYNNMFHGCVSLTSAPALPATTLADSCYASMFEGCVSLTSAPALPATTLADSCYASMFEGCTGITSHDVATLNTSQGVFRDNTSCASFTIHAVEPPVIDSTTITGLKADCIIYVPAAAVNAYKGARLWGLREPYIQAMPE